MNNNKYWNLSLEFKKEIENHLKTILEKYKNELEIKIADFNLLNDNNNIIESSTAIGFCIEEFVVSKLIEITSNQKNNLKKFFIERNVKKNISSSFDCFSKKGC